MYCSRHGDSGPWVLGKDKLLHCEYCLPLGVDDLGLDTTTRKDHLHAADQFANKLKAANVAADLDPNDPFDKVILKMVETNRAKRRDYAADGDIFSNFRNTASNLAIDGFGPLESAYTLLLTKVSRLRSLRANGRMADPSNESTLDTWLDLAVYAVICFALAQEANYSASPQN